MKGLPKLADKAKDSFATPWERDCELEDGIKPKPDITNSNNILIMYFIWKIHKFKKPGVFTFV